MSLENVLWVGGPPGSGKTTVAEWFAIRHGLRYWGADKFTQIHHRLMVDEQLPAMVRWQAMTHDERWLGDPAEMADLSLDISARRGELIIQDLQQQPPTQPIVAEGTPLRPSVINDVVAGPQYAVWIVPTPAAEERNLRGRGGNSYALTSDPARAETNRIAREILVGERIAQEANELGMHVIRADEEMTLDQVIAAVEVYFAPLLSSLPLAKTNSDRHELRRAENAAMLEHLKDFLEEMPSVGTPATYVGRFVCECGWPGETEHVDMSLTDFEKLLRTGQTLVAPGHRSSPADRVRRVRERLFEAGVVVGADGSAKPLFPVAIGLKEGMALRDWVRREGALRTFETGLAYAIGTLFICEGVLENGSDDGHHVAADPYQFAGLPQHKTSFEGVGIEILKEAGLDDFVTFYPEESQVVLPRLLSEGRAQHFDLAFLDGNHRFEGVFLDLVYAGRLLKEGGIVFVDDTQLPGIRRAVNFCVTNLGWTIEEEDAESEAHAWTVLRTGSVEAYERPFAAFTEF